MTQGETFEGKDLGAALAAAASRFGAAPEELTYEVVRAERGFLGVGWRGVEIRVTAPERRRPERAPTRARHRVERGEARAAVAAEGERPPLGAGGGEESEGAEEREETAVAMGPDPTVPQVAELARAVVAESGLALITQTVEEEDRIVVNVAGEDRDRLLERRADGLNALQYLLNRMARKTLGTAKRIQVESEGYRSDRDAEIREMALEAAERVLRDGEPVRLPPLNPYERRIVHVTLSRKTGITTESEGDGFIKRVHVRPAGEGRPGRGGRRRG